MVLERAGRVELCLGGFHPSNPPSCDGPAVVGWDWEAVDGETSTGGTTWGDYSVVGTWDGSRFTLTEPPAEPKSPSHSGNYLTDFTTPCRPPPGGWAVVNPASANEAGLEAAGFYAQGQPEFTGSWVDQSMGRRPARLILNVRFTSDLARHEAAIRSLWGGSLCVTRGDYTHAELLEIQTEVQTELAEVGSGAPPWNRWRSAGMTVSGVVFIDFVLADPSLQMSLDERYGKDVVKVGSYLQPVT